MDFVSDLAFAVAVTVGLTSAFKTAVNSDSFDRFSPLLAQAIAIGFSVAKLGFFFESVIYGVVVALMSSGLYSGTKSVINR